MRWAREALRCGSCCYKRRSVRRGECITTWLVLLALMMLMSGHNSEGGAPGFWHATAQERGSKMDGTGNRL